MPDRRKVDVIINLMNARWYNERNPFHVVLALVVGYTSVMLSWPFSMMAYAIGKLVMLYMAAVLWIERKEIENGEPTIDELEQAEWAWRAEHGLKGE